MLKIFKVAAVNQRASSNKGPMTPLFLNEQNVNNIL